MPCDYSKYPSNWREIRAQILERADNRCEFEGCGLPNHCYILRREDGQHWPPNGWPPDIVSDAHAEEWIPDDFEHIEKLTRVVLTIMHLDHDTTNNDPSNLKSACQYHHLHHDRFLHGKNAAATRARKKREQIEAQGQMALNLEGV